MRGPLDARLRQVVRRLRRIERRELAAFGQWIENTQNLVHLTVLALVPLLIALVTTISNALVELSFLLFPPLASGTYTLFSDPEGRFSSPGKFVAGLTLGACCGWVAILLGGAAVGSVSPRSAALSIFLVGVVTWALDVEEPAAFSTALLVLVTDDAAPEAYVLSVLLFGTIVAAAFALWRDRFYERRARYLYGAVRADDHVLVPMRGETTFQTAIFAARLAAAHEAGKVVLLDIVGDEEIEAAERSLLESGAIGRPRTPEESRATAEAAADRAARDAADELERYASEIRNRVGVHCEAVVASGPPATTTLETARDANCDLVVAPYEEDRGLLSPFVRDIFSDPVDAVAFRSTTGADAWRRVLVMVSRPGDSAHAMVDFAVRLAGPTGVVSVCTCIDAESERRRAESTLMNVVETADGPIETRVARSKFGAFIEANAGAYDLLVLGGSRDRSAASRFVSPPTFERLRGLPCDVAVVDRGSPR